MCGKCHVIAINDAHRVAPWADILYSSDRPWWRHYKGVPTFLGLKCGIGSGVGKQNPLPFPDVRVFKNSGYYGLELNENGLRNGGNSGYAAVNLAVHCGAKRILLLGYNFNRHGGKAHFFGNHPPGLQQQHSDSVFVSRRKLFQTLVEPLASLGIQVTNCTPDTSLTAFPLGNLRDVLSGREVAA